MVVTATFTYNNQLLSRMPLSTRLEDGFREINGREMKSSDLFVAVGWKQNFRYKATRYTTMRRLYRETKSDQRHFRTRLIVVRFRYDVLMMDEKSAGLQGTLLPKCFRGLKSSYDCSTECFASPQNCQYSKFCSLFYDSDRWFGSRGSFYYAALGSGSFQTNPPFDAMTLRKAVKRIRWMLSRSTTRKEPSSFCFVCPESARVSTINPLINSFLEEDALKGLSLPPSSLPSSLAHDVLSGSGSGSGPAPSRALVYSVVHLEKGAGLFEAGLQHVGSDSDGFRSAVTFSFFFLQNELGARTWPARKEEFLMKMAGRY